MSTTQLGPNQPNPAAQAPGAQQQQQGLPPTGMQQQMASLNQMYSQVQGAGRANGGYDVRQQQFNQAQQQPGQGQLQGPGGGGPMGSSSLDMMARNLAQRYGLPIGRGRIVDEQGNFLVSPQQLADASGGKVTLGDAAAQMNYIGQAIARQQNEKQHQKGIAAMQTGLGLVQSRGRGSLAAMQSGFYEGLGNMEAGHQYEAADFSYYIQKEQQQIAEQMQARQEKQAKRAARGQMFAGAGLTIAGILTGNPMLIASGAGNLAGGASGSGWF